MQADVRYRVSNLLYKMDRKKDYSKQIGVYEVPSSVERQVGNQGVIIFKEGSYETVHQTEGFQLG